MARPSLRSRLQPPANSSLSDPNKVDNRDRKMALLGFSKVCRGKVAAEFHIIIQIVVFLER
jgi:hypothetical protein